MNRAVTRPGPIAWAAIALFVLFIPLTISAQTHESAGAPNFDHEPDVRQVQSAALRATGLTNASEHRWGARARLAHVLPEVRGEIAWLDQRDIEISYREDIEADSGEFVTDSRNDYVDDARLRGVYAV
ncbi:MAG: hypothetical protein ACQEVA_20800, partial [Myxococcota bacterium]